MKIKDYNIVFDAIILENKNFQTQIRVHYD